MNNYHGLMPGGSPEATFALGVAARATALMAVAFACHAALGRRRALARSALWNATLVGLLILPLASLALPRVGVAVLPARIEAGPVARAPSLVAPPDAPASLPSPEAVLVAPAPSPSALIPQPSADARGPAPVADRGPRVGVGSVALGVYLVVAALLAIRLAASLAAVDRLRRGCVPVEGGPWSDGVDRWRETLGIGRRVPVLATGRVSVPVVVGWLRPAILLPEGLVDAAKPGLVDAVVLHELGHVRRGDFAWNVARSIVQAAYWPHPLAWPVGRVVAAVREQAVDDLCVHALGGPVAYRASLLEVASGLVRRPCPAPGLAMAASTHLGRRLAWIDRTAGASRCLLRWPVRLAVVLALSAAAGGLGSIELARGNAIANAEARPADEPAPPARPKPGLADEVPASIEVVVTSRETGKPIEGARVRPLIDHEQPLMKTDREGRLRIDLSRRESREALSLDVWADGHVQQRYFFAQHDSRHPKTPDRLAVELWPGEETLGGTVTDEQARPIAGVTVQVWGYLGSMKQKEELAFKVDATTDDRGQWRCRCFRGMKFAYLYLSHPDYVPDNDHHPRRHGQPTPSSQPQPGDKPLEALRDFSDVQVLMRGVEVAGEVRDDGRMPVAGAEVGWLEASGTDTFHHLLPTTTTDERGRFRVPHSRAGKVILQVKAKGHAPELIPVEAKDGAAPVAIELKPPRTLSGRVVDSKGRPIAEASVIVDTWRGYRALGVYLRTDAEGRFRWEDATADPVLLGASRVGYDAVFQQRASVDDGEILLTLRRSLAISGKVVDAATGKAIERSQVEVGIPDPKTGEVRWARDNKAFAMQGRLQATLDAERSPEYRLRVSARGYRPAESRLIRSDEGQAESDFKLEKADQAGLAVSGVVLGPDGRPLEGAEVALAYPLGGRDRLPTVQVEGGKIQPRPDREIVRTDAQGRFTLTREPDPAGRYFAVVVVHPDAYAEVPRAAIEADPTIRARPWGRVEGVLRVGSRPATGGEARYYSDRLGNADVPEVSGSGTAKADAEGRFVLERVVPGDVRVARGVEPGTRARAWTNGTLVEVRPGETTRADVGGRGRPVVARIELPEGFDPKADYAAYSEFEIESVRERMPYPPDLRAKLDGSMVDWGKRWWASAEGHEYRRNWFSYGPAKIRADGTLGADDIPPGEYRLRLTLGADPIYGLSARLAKIAHATKTFVIPEIPEGRSDEPFDLGTLRPSPR